MKKIALVSPHANQHKLGDHPTLGLLYLAAVAEQLGNKVDIIEATPEKFRFDFSNHDVVGFSIPSASVYSVIQKVKNNSTFSKGSLMVAGGVHATAWPEEVFDDLGLDIVCVGEGEQTIKEVLAGLPKKNIDGIVYKDGDNFVRTKKRDRIIDLDNLPFPARHLVPAENFVQDYSSLGDHKKTSYIITSRGCAGSCNFCANHPGKTHYRSGENVNKELELLKEKYGVKSFFIFDSRFSANKEKVKNICEAIKSLDMKWGFMCHVNDIDPEILAAMAKAGCIELEFGIESGSQRMLDAMNKRTTTEQNERAIRLAQEAGITVTTLMLHGYPGENMESTQETLRFLKRTKPDRVFLNRFAPMPGSSIYHEMKKSGLAIPDLDEIIHVAGSRDSDDPEMDKMFALLADYVEALPPATKPLFENRPSFDLDRSQ